MKIFKTNSDKDDATAVEAEKPTNESKVSEIDVSKLKPYRFSQSAIDSITLDSSRIVGYDSRGSHWFAAYKANTNGKNGKSIAENGVAPNFTNSAPTQEEIRFAEALKGATDAELHYNYEKNYGYDYSDMMDAFNETISKNPGASIEDAFLNACGLGKNDSAMKNTQIKNYISSVKSNSKKIKSTDNERLKKHAEILSGSDCVIGISESDLGFDFASLGDKGYEFKVPTGEFVGIKGLLPQRTATGKDYAGRTVKSLKNTFRKVTDYFTSALSDKSETQLETPLEVLKDTKTETEVNSTTNQTVETHAEMPLNVNEPAAATSEPYQTHDDNKPQKIKIPASLNEFVVDMGDRMLFDGQSYAKGEFNKLVYFESLGDSDLAKGFMEYASMFTREDLGFGIKVNVGFIAKRRIRRDFEKIKREYIRRGAPLLLNYAAAKDIQKNLDEGVYDTKTGLGGTYKDMRFGGIKDGELLLFSMLA